MVATQLEVADPFAELGSRAEDFEMIRGVLREAEAMGGRHGEVGGDLHGHLWVFVKGHDSRGRLQFRHAVRSDPDPTYGLEAGCLVCRSTSIPEPTLELVIPARSRLRG